MKSFFILWKFLEAMRIVSKALLFRKSYFEGLSIFKFSNFFSFVQVNLQEPPHSYAFF